MIFRIVVSPPVVLFLGDFTIAVLVVCAFIFVSESSKCPNCGRHGVIINPYSKKFGICKYCGNLGEREFFEED